MRDRKHGGVGRVRVHDTADIGPAAHDVEMKAPFG